MIVIVQVIRRKIILLFRHQCRLQRGQARKGPAGTVLSLIPGRNTPSFLPVIIPFRKFDFFLCPVNSQTLRGFAGLFLQHGFHQGRAAHRAPPSAEYPYLVSQENSRPEMPALSGFEVFFSYILPRSPGRFGSRKLIEIGFQHAIIDFTVLRRLAAPDTAPRPRSR